MYYYWLSFSKIVPEGQHGNIGAFILESNQEMSSADEVISEARRRGVVPEGAPSIRVAIIDEETARTYSIGRLMTREELQNRSDVEHQRSSVNVCSDCAEELNKPRS